MPSESEELSLSNDLSVLRDLTSSRVAEISKLLDRARPSKTSIKKHTPEAVLRLLLVYSKLLEATDLSEQNVDVLSSLREWFDENIPDVERLAGFEEFLELGQVALGDHSVSLSTTLDETRRAITTSMKSINSYFCYPSLAKTELSPNLRVFLLNEADVVLDSTGDWDDWLYVIKCLLNSLEKQSRSIDGTSAPWKTIPWEKVASHMSQIKKDLKSFNATLNENIPADVNVPGLKKKAKRTKDGKGTRQTS